MGTFSKNTVISAHILEESLSRSMRYLAKQAHDNDNCRTIRVKVFRTCFAMYKEKIILVLIIQRFKVSALNLYIVPTTEVSLRHLDGGRVKLEGRTYGSIVDVYLFFIFT